MTDKKEHAEDAGEARKENMSLTPRIEIIEGKNQLLAWEETVAMHASEGGAAQPAEPAQEPPAASEPAEKPKRTRKGGAK